MRHVGERQPLEIYANFEVAVGIGSVAIGLLLILTPNTQLFDSYNSTIAQAFWQTESLSSAAMRMNHWLLATCGAGVIGWGITWTVIAHIPFRAGETWACKCLLVSLVVWVLLDICCALWFGVTGEVVFVLVAMFVGIIPLLLATRHLRRDA
jgi:hypothetical protein